MKQEKHDLILDLQDDEHAGRREATLLAGARILRRKRWRRYSLQALAALAILGIAAFSLQRTKTSSTSQVIVSAPAALTQPKALTDEELLALFPDIPVALAALDNGQKRLIFPRAGDEARFVTRM